MDVRRISFRKIIVIFVGVNTIEFAIDGASKNIKNPELALPSMKNGYINDEDGRKYNLKMETIYIWQLYCLILSVFGDMASRTIDIFPEKLYF